MNILQKLVKNYYRNKGYEIVLRKYKLMKGEYPQDVILPRSTYAPWKNDEVFMQLFEQISSHTRVDIYRCYEIWQLCNEQATLPGDFMEIGVWRGGTGAIIAKAAQMYSSQSKVFLGDTFSGVVKAGENDNKYINGEHADTSENIVRNLLSDLQLDNTVIMKGMFPDDTAHLVQDNTFKFCHIDVDVYEGAREVTNWIFPRLVIGGCIVYDDYGFSGTQGVTKFVESQRQKEDRTVIHNLNGHGIIIRIK